jgi:hypothetical protein
MKKLALASIALWSLGSLTACNVADAGRDGSSCSVVEADGEVRVDCTDGTSTVIPDAAAGSAIATSDEVAGENCENGGTRVDHGLDANGNGALDAEEVKGTTYVCNGAAGEAGQPGQAGAPGAPGAGGQDAVQALIVTTSIAAGVECPNGGVQIDAGMDTDDNGTLEPTEITSSTVACNGAPGANGLTALVVTRPEPTGINCAAGGTRIDTGLDMNGDQQLQVSEISQTSYVCGARSCDAATEVSFGGRCYYLDGAACGTGYGLAPQSILTTIAGSFVGKNNKTVASQSCCIQHSEQTTESQDWGMVAPDCNGSNTIVTGPVLGGSNCTNTLQNFPAQLRICVSN